MYLFFSYFFSQIYLQCSGCNTGRSPPCHDVIVQPIVVIDLVDERNSIALGIFLSQVNTPSQPYDGKLIEMTRATQIYHDEKTCITYAYGFGMHLDGSGREIPTKIEVKDEHAYVFLVLYILFCNKTGREVWTIEKFMDQVEPTTMNFQ